MLAELYNAVLEKVCNPSKPFLIRDPRWSAFRKRHLASSCAACGFTEDLELHHILPVHESRRRGIKPEFGPKRGGNYFGRVLSKMERSVDIDANRVVKCACHIRKDA